MVLGDGTFGRRVGLDEVMRVELKDGISVLRRDTSASSTREDVVEDSYPQPKKRAHQTLNLSHSDPGLPSPQNYEK